MVSPKFLALLEAEDLKDKVVLDVGCGAGRLTFLIASRCRSVTGIDRDTTAIVQARRRAAAERIGNAVFSVADAEAVEYDSFAPQLIAAHLCMSDAIIARCGRALAPGECLVFVAFHVDQWRETGRPSRFAYDEARLASVLRENGFVPEHLEVEREVTRFGTVQDGLAAAAGLEDKWKADGRWPGYVEFLERGGRSLTRSRLIVKARRR
ncbi:MAG: methyltransferase domain-containing protein [Candidatus Rokubacteria bacterium]|nr:methyltransferase domain-containing protein [Candidatus Rokubacteria bacterium]